ncbi:MAG: hypothetical protein H6R10_3322 [Rhodocyclaceae bacterium]|nr:hypothetical protein [Rhodocyclaceae bacterium]
MTKLISAVLAAVFALASVSVMACPDGKTQSDQQISKPAKPKV